MRAGRGLVDGGRRILIPERAGGTPYGGAGGAPYGGAAGTPYGGVQWCEDIAATAWSKVRGIIPGGSARGWLQWGMPQGQIDPKFMMKA